MWAFVQNRYTAFDKAVSFNFTSFLRILTSLSLLRALLCLFLVMSAFAPLWAQPTFDERLTDQSNIRATIANVGLFGNSFKGSYTVKGYPSCEYPAGSGNENCGLGGLWVGAQVGNNRFVSTSAFSSASGYAPNSLNFEFATEKGFLIKERSSLRSRGALYRDEAISHQDYLMDFTEKYKQAPGTIGSNPNAAHTPLGLDVHLESYNWNYNYSNFFIIFNYKIKNVGRNKLDSVFVGFWAETVLRNVLSNPPGSLGFYTKGGNGYIDSLNAAYEYDASPDDIAVKSYAGIKFLGATDKAGFRYAPDRTGRTDSTKYFRTTFRTWQYNATGGDFAQPATDEARYRYMQTSMRRLTNWKTDSVNMKNGASRSLLISAGPFASLNPTDSARGIKGDSILITFALVCARRNFDGNPLTYDSPEEKVDLVKNMQWVQSVFDGNDHNHDGRPDSLGDTRPVKRYILPTPPDMPITKVVAGDHKVDLYWSDNAEQSIDPISLKRDFQGYRLYRSTVGFETGGSPDVEANLHVARTFDRDNDTLFANTGFKDIRLTEPMMFDGDTTKYWYKYSFANIQNGWQHAVALTAFDNGDTVNALPSLESSVLQNLHRAFAGKPANPDAEKDAPFVYPNPYYGSALWEASGAKPEQKKLMFANLPARCVIRVFTASGDLVDEINHDQSYNGSGSKWYTTNSNPDQNVMSGGEHAWDLLSKFNQITARGLYLFSVEDLDTKKQYKGRFTLIK
ncbi:MAG: hypothetical protein V4543_12550 [Bacteroidota bacterium]